MQVYISLQYQNWVRNQ